MISLFPLTVLTITDFAFLIKTFTAQDSQYKHWWFLEGLGSDVFVHSALKVFSKCRRGNNANNPGAIHLLRTHENSDFTIPTSPLHAPCLSTTSEYPLNTKHVTGDLQPFYCATKQTKVLYVNIISTSIHMIYMEYDCHIFLKHLVFHFINLVFQTKHLVFRPEISAVDRNTWSY